MKIEKNQELYLKQSNIITSQIKSSITKISKNKYVYQYINSIINDFSFSLNSRILVLNEKGNVLIDSNGILENENLLYLDEIKESLEGENIISNYQKADKKFSYIATPIKSNDNINGVILISSSLKPIYNEVFSLMEMTLFISVIALLLTLILSLIFAETISIPIRKLSKSIKEKYSVDEKNIMINNKLDEIHELKRLFNLMKTKLEQVETRRKKFVSNVSHELRTPITSMRVLSDTIISGDDWDREIYDEFMEDINNELKRLSNIIDDLLYLVEVEKDEVDFAYELTSLNYLISNTIKTLKPIAKKKNLKLHFEEMSKVQIYIDRSKFRRALINLISNSIKYTNEGYVKVKIEKNKNEIIILIKDTGIGISKNDLPYIFDRFYKTDKSRKYKQGSTGLGLSIAKEIIELHGGVIDVKSEINVGTKFIVKIPKENI
ncbi:MAG: ATP-binding protein [Bacillota bacterium]